MIIQNFQPVIGGAEKQALALSTALVNNGHSVDVLTMSHPTAPARETFGGVNIHRLPAFGPILFRTAVFALFSGIKLVFTSGRYDAIHTHLASSHSIFPAIWGRLTGKKVIVKIGGGFGVGELALSRNSIIGKFKLKIFAWAQPDFIVVNTGQLEELAESGLSESRVAFIPNGVDLSIYYPPDALQKNDLREKFKMKGLVFLFVGRFAPDKLRIDIFDRFLDAWASVINKEGGMTFFLVGQGPLEPAYRKSIARLGLEASVRIMGSTDRVADYMQAADVFVLPSITEGLSNALLEALGCGLPVCGSRVSGIVDVINEGKQGALFSPHDTADIARAIASLVKDPERVRAMAAECTATARAYSMEVTVQKTLDLYQQRRPRQTAGGREG